MLIIQSRSIYHDAGMGRYYRGSGIVGTIARKAFSRGIEKGISSGTSSVIAHKVVDAVVNGASSATAKKVAKTILKVAVAGAAGNVAANVVNSAIDSIAQKVGGQKRPTKAVNDSTIATKIKKLDIDRMIDGSGIVYD